MNIEVEIKLAIDDATITLLQQHPLLQQAERGPIQQQLISTYFDTPTAKLRQAGFAVRIRQDGNSFIQTLKARNTSVTGLTSRQEWEWPLTHFALDLSVITLPTLQNLLASRRFIAALQPHFTTEFTRTLWYVQYNETLVEVALDQGRVKAGNKTMPIQEVELELKTGNETDLQALAKQLSTDLNLSAENRSKASRGYLLARPKTWLGRLWALFR